MALRLLPSVRCVTSHWIAAPATVHGRAPLPRARITQNTLAEVEASNRSPTPAAVLQGIGLHPGTAAELVHAVTAGGALEAEGVEAVCRVLVDVAGVPVAALAEVLQRAPEVLAVPAPALASQFELLREVWADDRRLRSAVRSHPAILTQKFSANLKRCMAMLEELGFSKSQTAAAILGAPNLAQLRRYELVSALTQAGVVLAGADPAVFDFLSKKPQCLTLEGSPALAAVLRQLASWGLDPQQAQSAVALCPRILAAGPQRLAHVADALREFGLSQQQRVVVATGWPSALAKGPARVRQTLALLFTAGITPAQLAAYPRCFIHSPLRVVGPRLAYLQAHEPAELRRSLATLLSRSDEEFVERLGDTELDAFLGFAESWQAQYARRKPPWPPERPAAPAAPAPKQPRSEKPADKGTLGHGTAGGRGEGKRAAPPEPAPGSGRPESSRGQGGWRGGASDGWARQGPPGSRRPQPGNRPPGSRPQGQGAKRRSPTTGQLLRLPPPASPAKQQGTP